MNQTVSNFVDSDVALEMDGNVSLVFVDDAEYEFVGGGAASTNVL